MSKFQLAPGMAQLILDCGFPAVVLECDYELVGDHFVLGSPLTNEGVTMWEACLANWFIRSRYIVVFWMEYIGWLV